MSSNPEKTSGNTNRIMWWLIGGLFTLSMTFGAASVSSMDRRIDTAVDGLKNLSEVVTIDGKTIVKHESDITYVKDSLTRIESKIDRLINSNGR